MDAIVLKSEEGKVIPRPKTHGAVMIKIANGATTIFQAERSAGDAAGPGMHSHPGFDESFYVVSGEWEFTADDKNVVAESGTLVHIPRGTFHGFRSTGRLDGKLLVIAVPGGIEAFFEESAKTANDAKAGRRHGIEFVVGGEN